MVAVAALGSCPPPPLVVLERGLAPATHRWRPGRPGGLRAACGAREISRAPAQSMHRSGGLRSWPSARRRQAAVSAPPGCFPWTSAAASQRRWRPCARYLGRRATAFAAGRQAGRRAGQGALRQEAEGGWQLGHRGVASSGQGQAGSSPGNRRPGVKPTLWFYARSPTVPAPTAQGEQCRLGCLPGTHCQRLDMPTVTGAVGGAHCLRQGTHPTGLLGGQSTLYQTNCLVVVGKCRQGGGNGGGGGSLGLAVVMPCLMLTSSQPFGCMLSVGFGRPNF